MQQINGDLHREKTDKKKETIFFCFRVLVWVAALAALFALAANLRVAAAVPESLKDTNITIEPAQAEQTCHTHIASTTIGRLGYDLYSDGTATVTDETGRMLGLEAKHNSPRLSSTICCSFRWRRLYIAKAKMSRFRERKGI